MITTQTHFANIQKLQVSANLIITRKVARKLVNFVKVSNIFYKLCNTLYSVYNKTSILQRSSVTLHFDIKFSRKY